MTPQTVARQTPQSMGFSRQEYWNELPFPSPGDLPNPGNEPRSPALLADSLPTEPLEKPNNFIITYLYFSTLVKLIPSILFFFPSDNFDSLVFSSRTEFLKPDS